MLELEDELMLYPRAKNDDLLDGLFYANKNAYIPSHSSKKEKDKNKNDWWTVKKADWRIM